MKGGNYLTQPREKGKLGGRSVTLAIMNEDYKRTGGEALRSTKSWGDGDHFREDAE